jgi:hypothetical protein
MEYELEHLKEDQQREDDELNSKEKDLDKLIKEIENANAAWAAIKGIGRAALYTLLCIVYFHCFFFLV